MTSVENAYMDIKAETIAKMNAMAHKNLLGVKVRIETGQVGEIVSVFPDIGLNKMDIEVEVLNPEEPFPFNKQFVTVSMEEAEFANGFVWEGVS